MMQKHVLKLIMGLIWGAIAVPESTVAQGIPVFDSTSIAKQIEQIAQLTQQISTMKQQLTQLTNLNNALSKLGNMGQIAPGLDQFDTRQALPGNFSNVEQVLNGQGAGTYAGLSSGFQSNNTIYTPDSNEYYAQAVRSAQKGNAGEQALSQSMYDAAARRMDGITQLKSQIDQSVDTKDTLDLIARMQSEMLFMQADMLKMQSLIMAQNSSTKVRQEQDHEQELLVNKEIVKVLGQ